MKKQHHSLIRPMFCTNEIINAGRQIPASFTLVPPVGAFGLVRRVRKTEVSEKQTFSIACPLRT